MMKMRTSSSAPAVLYSRVPDHDRDHGYGHGHGRGHDYVPPHAQHGVRVPPHHHATHLHPPQESPVVSSSLAHGDAHAHAPRPYKTPAE